MQSFFLPFRSSRIHYLLGGTGRKLLLCLHGYGESAESWAFLESSLADEYTILAIDLPFHGLTDWQEGFLFEPETLIFLIGEIARDWADSQYLLMGYSMGGRIALSLMEKIPNKIQKLVLLAPDGLKVNKWYWLATQTRLGNRIFRWTIHHPGWLFSLLRAGNGLRLINRSIYKFTRHFTENAAERQKLYARWTTMCAFRPHLPRIHSLLRTHQIQLRLLYGQHDRIIRASVGEKFLQSGIQAQSRLLLVPTGHQLLQPRNCAAILSLLSE